MHRVFRFLSRLLTVHHAIVALSVLTMLLLSCSGGNVSRPDTQYYNVELKPGHEVRHHCSPDSVMLLVLRTAEYPVLIESTPSREARYVVTTLNNCKNLEDNIYEIPASHVARITDLSDPLRPPLLRSDSLPPPPCCTRDRNADFLSFNKIELRAMAGLRGTDEDTYQHQGPNGLEPFESSFFNFDRGGGNFLLGFEMAALWDLDDGKHWQLGPFLGLWPVDDAWFVPVALHGRYTFTPEPHGAAPFCDCTTFFVYADIGLPLGNSDAPTFGVFDTDIDRQRYFWGIGAGHDWDVNHDLDFSIDIGLRMMNLPLPQIECCEDVPIEQRFPYRQSTALIFRIGFTF